MKIAYVIRNGFYPPFNGERIKSAALASALADCGDLHVLDLGNAEYPGGAIPRGERFELPYGGRAMVTSLSYKNGQAGHKRWRPFRIWAAQKLLETLDVDVLVVDHPVYARLALRARTNLRIVHCHNVESQLAKSIHAKKPTFKHWLRSKRFDAVERKLLPRVDQVWAVSDADAIEFKARGSKKVVATPNILPPSAFVDDRCEWQQGRAAFFGWLAYPPNADAATVLMNLAAELPTAWQLDLIGKGLPEQLLKRAQDLPNVVVHGFVDSLEQALQSIGVVAIPLRQGAGTKLKVIESLALGKVLLTTPVGAQGLGLVDGKHALIREPGAGFAETLVNVLAEPERFRHLAAAGQALARERFSLRMLKSAVKEALPASR